MPLPDGIAGLTGSNEFIDTLGWENYDAPFVTPPVGSIDVADFQFVSDPNFLPVGGFGVVGPVSIQDLFDDSVGNASISSLVLMPEPSSIILVASGICCFLFRRRRI